MNSSTVLRPSFISSFSRSQISSLLATLMDYGFLFLAVEFLHIWYVIATALGALIGAITNFILNRYWSFQASHGLWADQARRYALVSFMSLLLNTGGVYLVTELCKIHYAISVACVSIFVGVFFNYPLHRHYVYRI